MGSRFTNWLRCPGCENGGPDVSAVAYNAEIVLECQSCGETAEFAIGEDVPFNSLDAEVIADKADVCTD